MLDPKLKASIDEMTVEQMLRRLRYAPAGDPMFKGETGQYFHAVYKAKRDALPPGEYVQMSHRVGWEKKSK